MSVWDQITIREADITELEVDAIVNAANTSLLGGGGVDGAIHRADGKELLAECRMLDGCAVGNAKITKGYKLPAKYVLHTVGPKWNGGDKGERGKLASCYRRCMELAQSHAFHSIAFPGVSTGVYGYPQREAADTALATIHEFLVEHPMRIAVIMCTHDGPGSGSSWTSDSRVRLRVISTRPSSLIFVTFVRARSRDNAFWNASQTLRRLPSLSMSTKSTTMMPPMLRSRSWRATSSQASRLFAVTVSSRLPEPVFVNEPVLISIAVSASP